MAATLHSFCTIFYIMMITVKLTSQCIQTGNGNGLPSFITAEGRYRIFQHHQAIIYTYRFNCCGNIRAWGVDVYPGERWRNYTVDFQVWRPSPTEDDSTGTAVGYYSLVGNNRFTSISLSSGLAQASPSPQDYIQFRPGDVLGFYMESNYNDNPGIVLNNDRNREVVWYASMDPDEASLLRKGCPYTLLAGASNELPTALTHAAPIISISTSTYPCPTTPSSTRVLCPCPTIQSSTILSSTAAIRCPMESSDTNISGDNLTPTLHFLFGFIAGIIILILIVVPANIVIFLKKSQRAIQDRISNQVYAELPNPILTRDQNDNTPSSNIMLPAIEAPAEDISIHECIRQEGNQAYGINIDGIITEENQAYTANNIIVTADSLQTSDQF